MTMTPNSMLSACAVIAACLLVNDGCAKYLPSAARPLSQPTLNTFTVSLERALPSLNGKISAEWTVGHHVVRDIEWDMDAPSSIVASLTKDNDIALSFSPPLQVNVIGLRWSAVTVGELRFSNGAMVYNRISVSRRGRIMRRERQILLALAASFEPAPRSAMVRGDILAFASAQQFAKISASSLTGPMLAATIQLREASTGHQAVLANEFIGASAVVSLDIRNSERRITLRMAQALLSGTVVTDDVGVSFNALKVRDVSIANVSSSDGSDTTSVRAAESRGDLHTVRLRYRTEVGAVALSGSAKLTSEDTEIVFSGNSPRIAAKRAVLVGAMSMIIDAPHLSGNVTAEIALKGDFGLDASCDCSLVLSNVTGTATLSFPPYTFLIPAMSVSEAIMEMTPGKSIFFLPYASGALDVKGSLIFPSEDQLYARVESANVEFKNLLMSQASTYGTITIRGYTAAAHSTETVFEDNAVIADGRMSLGDGTHHYSYKVGGDNTADTRLRYVIRHRAGVTSFGGSLDAMHIHRRFDEGLRLLLKGSTVGNSLCTKDKARYYPIVFDLTADTRKVEIKEEPLGSGTDPQLAVPAIIDLEIAGGHGQYDDRDAPEKGFRGGGSRPWRDYQEVFSDTSIGGCTFHKYVAPQRAKRQTSFSIKLTAPGSPLALGAPKDLSLPLVYESETNGCALPGQNIPAVVLRLCGDGHIYKYLLQRMSAWTPVLNLTPVN